jgi:asparagine synthase (glutamine-hydrolysing)
MSGLCGWMAADRAATAAPEAITGMAARLTRYDGSPARVAAAEFGAVAASAIGNDADVFRNEDVLVAISGRPRFTDRDLAEHAQRHGVAAALAHAYVRRHTDVFAALSGSFALALLDSHSREAVLAIDRTGTQPLCYGARGQQLVFGSTLDAMAAFPGAQADIDAQAIYDYVHFHMVPGPRTIREGQQRLLPGTYMLWRDGVATTGSYWKMRYSENEQRAFPALKETFIALLRDSVRTAARDSNVGAFLSGGTDSSTLAGMLCDVTGRPARTYSIGFEAEGYDEMDYARIAARHFGTDHHEYYVTPDDVVAAIPRIAAVHDQPFGNASAVPTYYCAKLAKADGTDVLLGGDGGDELFGGNDRYAKQYLYSLYGDLPAALRKGVIEPIAMLVPSVGIAGKVQRYMRNASESMPARYDNYNLLERLGAANVFTTAFLETVDPRQPQARFACEYGSAHARALINRMLALDLKYTLADNDLPKVIRSCELAGVGVRFPMLDDAVVAFSASLAPELKLKGTQLRYFFKEALRGYLPDAVITKTKHGFGLPFGLWLQTHAPLRELALDSLTDFKRRHIVRPGFIDELTSTHMRTHVAYYGTMVWILMMLEIWFAQRRGATQDTRRTTYAMSA